MRPIIINADDYAMDTSVDAGILHLAAKGVVTATSAMVLSPHWPEAARASRDAAPLSLGLHLDLTSRFAGDGAPPPVLSSLLARAQARLLDRFTLRRIIERQLMLFETHTGAAPDFVDGHQHVHHLPVVRDVLLEVLECRYGSERSRIGLRNCTSRKWRGAKAAIIEATGAGRFARLAESKGHTVNSDFAGVYGFAAGTKLPALWQSWASNLDGPLPLVMCHVAMRIDEAADGDPIREARYREFDWLASEEFGLLLNQLAIRPLRWPRA
jgi:hypothetical protein